MSSDLKRYRQTSGAEPLVFEPEVDWSKLREPTIVNAFCRNSIFFWSEEHARRHRTRAGFIDGVYLNLEQSAYATRIAQGGVFAF
ncbi:MAG TPA: hypothetical protein VN345_01245 [Blastocatellia bacterium]|nr:hypothetical protein [Blastocatellia bacterium]